MFHTVYYKETRVGRFDTLAEAKEAIKKHWVWNVGLEGVEGVDPDPEDFDEWMAEFEYVIKSRRKTTREKWDAHKKAQE